MDDLYKDEIMNKDSNFILDNGTEVKFRNFYF